MVSVKVNFKKKDLWLLSAIVVFLVGAGFVVAYGGNTPAVMGHSAGELEINVNGTIMTLQQAIINNLLGGSGSSGLANCAWTDYGICGAASGGQVLCPSNQVVNGIDSVGCSAACADVTRCEKTRLYCCDLS